MLAIEFRSVQARSLNGPQPPLGPHGAVLQRLRIDDTAGVTVMGLSCASVDCYARPTTLLIPLGSGTPKLAAGEAQIEPDWVSGVSIGAINSAIIAGNSRRRRLDRLRAFWELITERKIWHYTPDGDAFRKARNFASSWITMTQGQPGFFTPRNPNPWFSFPGAQNATSYYDSAPLRETLEDLVDFSMINEKAESRLFGRTHADRAGTLS